MREFVFAWAVTTVVLAISLATTYQNSSSAMSAKKTVKDLLLQRRDDCGKSVISITSLGMSVNTNEKGLECNFVD